MRGEPGDMRWENIYVNPIEMFLRRLFYYILITIALVGSLIGMLAAAITQKSIGGTPNLFQHKHNQ